MSEMLTDSPSAPFDHVAFAARQEALRTDPWRHKIILQRDFSGKIVDRRSAQAMFGDRNNDPNAPIQERVSRIILMLPYVRGMADGPGIWCDSVLKQIRSLARDIGQCDSARYPQQRAHLAAKYDALVIDTEFKLEEAIRLSLNMDKKPYLNHAAGLNFRVGAGSYAQPSRRQVHEGPPKFSAEAFVLRLRAAGIWARRDDATGGLAWAGGSALSFADRETLQDRIAEIVLFLNGRPDLCSPPAPPPPPPPPLPIVQSEEEPAGIEATPATSDEAIGARVAEPDLMTETVEPSADETMASPSTPANPTAQPRKRRHRYAHLSTIRHS